jgi:hypothetical protein
MLFLFAVTILVITLPQHRLHMGLACGKIKQSCQCAAEDRSIRAPKAPKSDDHHGQQPNNHCADPLVSRGTKRKLLGLITCDRGRVKIKSTSGRIGN